MKVNLDNHYRENYSMLIKALRPQVGGHHNAEDVVQEAYTRAVENIKMFDKQVSDFDTWFSFILKSCIRDKKREDIGHGMVYSLDTDGINSPSHTPSFELGHLVHQVISLIFSKPAIIKSVLHLALVRGYKYKDIANIVPMSEPNITKLVFNFRKELQAEGLMPL